VTRSPQTEVLGEGLSGLLEPETFTMTWSDSAQGSTWEAQISASLVPE
jgi:hypothetical protein